MFNFYQVRAQRQNTESSNAGLRQIERGLAGHNIFSTVPRIALLAPAPPLLEPYLLSYLLRLGKVNLNPILEGIDRVDYEGVITAPETKAWRGVYHIDDRLHAAIAASYKPHCLMRGLLLHLPRNQEPATSTLARDAEQNGCIAVAHDSVPRW